MPSGTLLVFYKAVGSCTVLYCTREEISANSRWNMLEATVGGLGVKLDFELSLLAQFSASFHIHANIIPHRPHSKTMGETFKRLTVKDGA